MSETSAPATPGALAPVELGPGQSVRPTQQTDADYEARARIYSSRWPDQKATPDEVRAGDRVRSPSARWEQWILEANGQASGYVTIIQAFWSGEEGLVSIGYELTPDLAGTETERRLLHYGLERALLREPSGVMLAAESRDPFSVALIEELGAELRMKQMVTRLDVLGFDPAPYREAGLRLQETGVRILSIAALEAEGFDWKRPLFDLYNAVLLDVPTPGGMKPEPWEDYVGWIEDPDMFVPEACFVAQETGRLIGMSAVDEDKAIPGRYQTGLTGVVREHRRRGLATALKATAIGWAKERGCTHISTDNASTNPMYLLNRKLGFADLYEVLIYVKPAGRRVS
jgi:GNAT superfamily N-acetyltransferase/predicted acetyltransferase